MDDAQHVIAVSHGVHHHPESKQVENLIQRFVLVKHLAIDGVGVLHSSVDLMADFHFREALVNLGLRAVHKIVVLGFFCAQG
ncbi:hypothetical protein SDC9_95457 [bioreactor metagenome]|uniref:Uncharacterized protein n=1 Tax=bioreactor metagenome TaxID=1076179 RepID=A0A645A6C8_9ZZZZ